MAFETFTAILNAAEFPFISSFFQRSIIVPGIDNPVRTPKDYYGTSESANFELAQHYYAQNIMPTAEGIMSVGYNQIIPKLLPEVTDFDQAMVLRDTDENNFLLVPSRGKNYIYTQNAGVWNSVNPFVGWTGNIVSRAYVNGRTFVCYQRNNIYEYSTAGGTFLPQPVLTDAPMVVGDIDVIGSSNNYLIAAVGIIIYWSSLIDPLDLRANIQTGAGSAIPQDMKGVARAIIPIAGGFIIYTTKNAVAAMYTNNARAPFIFREISNAGGVTGPEKVSLEASLGFHYALTTNGLQKITLNNAETLSTAAADFLAGRIYESFDLPTLTWTIERLTDDLQSKLTYISGRFLCISYGKKSTPQTYTHCLVYDLSFKRWGKLRKDHVDCFAYPYPNLLGFVTDTPPKQSVAFMGTNGQVDLLIMDYRERQNEGVLLLGRYQLVRNRKMTFQYVELEGLHQAYPPSVHLLLSQDGINNSAPTQLKMLYDGNQTKKFGAPTSNVSGQSAQRTGLNLSLLITGTIELTTAVFTTTKHGNR